ncbi:MAG: DUF4268 domain-containing protein [Paludibacteraceae bacterium]|nr:DUF4268 domain-containing protein [Paludibacteraceae bacterium]
MYSKDELKQLKKEFWEGFGIYCSEVPAMKKRKSKFMLYNTKMKGVELKFDATRDGAYVILEINHNDATKRFELYEKFETYKTIMEKDFPCGLMWNFAYVRECGTEVCRIYTHKQGIDIHRRIQWMEFYKFMVDEMLKLEKAFRRVKETIE